MLVPVERVGRPEHDHRGEQVPLHLQPGVGGEREAVAHEGIAGADGASGQDRDIGKLADRRVLPVDAAAEGDERTHQTTRILP